MSPEKREAQHKKFVERMERLVARKKANIAANSPSRREWYPYTTPIPEPDAQSNGRQIEEGEK